MSRDVNKNIKKLELMSKEESAIVLPDYIKEITEIVRSNVSPRKMKEQIEDFHENDIANTLETLPILERKKLYRIVDADMLADIFEYIEDEDQIVTYINELDLKKQVSIVSRMDSDRLVDILKKLGKEERANLIALMDEETKKEIALLSSFDEDEVGSQMTTNCIRIDMDLSVKQAMKALVEQAKENDNISTIYVLDHQETFYGAIDLKDLIVAREATPLEDLIMTSYPYVYATETIDECIEKFKEYSEDSIPVLDNENRLLGVLTSQDIIQIVDDEMGDDYAKLAGLTAEEDLQESLKDSIRKRMPWLVILLILGMLVSSVVGLFENVVAQLTIIVCFQSLVLDMSGNVGTQSLAVTIRVLMDETLTARQKLHLIWKEMRVGFSNGFILGILSFLGIGLYLLVFKQQTAVFAFSISGCIGVSLMVAMLISSLVGTIIPMFFHKIKVDPAVASGPLITTVNDMVAVITYYGLSWLFLIEIMKFV